MEGTDAQIILEQQHVQNFTNQKAELDKNFYLSISNWVGVTLPVINR
jgi:hypothetical protein